MKKIVLAISILLLFLSCEKKEESDNLLGKWKLVRGFNVMFGGYYNIPTLDQRIEEYRDDNIRILYDSEGNEIVRSNYTADKLTITISGKNNDGSDYSFDYKYWFQNDSLVIKQDGGFEFYNEYFIRVDALK